MECKLNTNSRKEIEKQLIEKRDMYKYTAMEHYVWESYIDILMDFMQNPKDYLLSYFHTPNYGYLHRGILVRKDDLEKYILVVYLYDSLLEDNTEHLSDRAVYNKADFVDFVLSLTGQELKDVCPLYILNILKMEMI